MNSIDVRTLPGPRRLKSTLAVAAAVGPPWGLRPRRLKRGAAVAAAAGLTLGLCLTVAPHAGAATAAHAASAPAVPRYYMALPGADNFDNVPGAPTAVLGDTLTGKRLLTVRPSGKDKFVSVSAAADDLTFVLGAAPGLQPPAVPMATDWYLVRVKPGRVFSATVSKLRVPAPSPGSNADATALSPDGKELGLLGIEPAPHEKYAEFLRVYSVATGKLLHAWSAQLNVTGDAYTTLSWTDGGRQLAFGYTYANGQYLGVRMVDVARPGNNLVTDSRLVWSIKLFGNVPSTFPFTCAIDLRAVVTPDGKTVVCSGLGVSRSVVENGSEGPCPAVPAWNSQGFLEYSTTTGKATRVLDQKASSCFLAWTDVLWTSASGSTVIGFFLYENLVAPAKGAVMRYGIFSHNRFTPLPVPPTTTTTPNAISW